jgi:hypothetical protein
MPIQNHFSNLSSLLWKALVMPSFFRVRTTPLQQAHEALLGDGDSSQLVLDLGE